tara:strand:+ start:110 stop:637 length:528 start_codon:yes stop_codon:yes gene_type:complete
MTASLTMLTANYNQRIILKKESLEGIDEYVINYNDLILIKCKNKNFPDSKYLGGQFIKTENNFILFENKTLLGKKSLESVHQDDIEALYVGNVRTWKDLRQRWTLYLSILTLPGSIQMGNHSSDLDEIPASVAFWAVFSGMAYYTYAPIFCSIDFHTKKDNATEFVIGKNEWVIN